MFSRSLESSGQRHCRRFAVAAIPSLVLGLIGVAVATTAGSDKSAATTYANPAVASGAVANKVRLITGDVVRVAEDGSVAGI